MAATIKARAGNWEAAAVTHPGRVRDHNEDTFVCAVDQGLFAVIDGMGGAQAGEVAAELARRALVEAPRGEHPRLAIQRANRRIVDQGRSRPEQSGMGCVVSAVRCDAHGLHVAHVGDTRVYLASSQGCEQLTRDHTLVAERQEALGLTEAEARALPGQHRVTRDVGRRHHDSLDWIEQAEAPFQHDDMLLLCSDGLHDLVSHGELVRILTAARRDGVHPEALVNRLVAMALARGGTDNVTILVVRRLRRRPRVQPRALVAGLVGMLAVGGGFLLGLRWHGPPPAPVPQGPPLVASLAQVSGDALLSSGPLDLSVPLSFSGTVYALGVNPVMAAESTTRVMAGADVALVGWVPAFPPGASRWDIQVAPGGRLVLRQVVLDAPELEITVALEGEGSELALLHCHLDVGSLTGSGVPDPVEGGLTVIGGLLNLRHQGDRPLLQQGRVDRRDGVWLQPPTPGSAPERGAP